MKMALLDGGYTSANPRLMIPPHLPGLLKHFTKAAIKTQPRDILSWAAGYFKCVVEEEPLPVKERLELVSEGGRPVSLGQLRILNVQLKTKEQVSVLELKRKCQVLSVNPELIDKVILIGGFKNRIRWETFLCVICSQITASPLEAMTLFCEVVTEEGEGGPALITWRKLLRALYIVLGPNNSPSNELLIHLAKCSKSQGGMLHPDNLKGVQL